MSNKKLSYFEVKRPVSRYLSWALGFFLLFQGIVELGDFVGLARVSSGPLVYGLSRITQSGVGHFLLSLVTTGLLVSIYECFRRSLFKAKSVISYLVLAIMTLMVCDFLVGLSTAGSTDIMQQLQSPTRFDSFAVRFKNTSAAFQSILALIMSIALVVKYRGRIALYGWVNLASMIISGLGVGSLYMFLMNHNVDFLNRGLSLAWTAFRYVIEILPVVFMRRTLIYKQIRDADERGDI